MKRVRSLWVLLFAAYLGCSSEGGGPVGTGISASSVSGNVVDVQTAAASGAAASLPSIEVTIDEVPGLAAATDADGNFELVGDFSGTIRLRFTTPHYQVTYPLDVPAGSTVVLADIELHPTHVDPHAMRQLGFLGHVKSTHCDSGFLVVADRRGRGTPWTVNLSSDTTIVDGDEQPADCGDIQVGELVAIEGTIPSSPDHTIDAVRIVLAPPGAPGPPPIRPLHFFGTVVSIDCDPDCDCALMLEDGSGTSRLHISPPPTTVIVSGNQQPLQCQDIAVGSHVTGNGLIDIRRPGLIEVRLLVVMHHGPH